jgi:hypothetical protein
VSPHPGDLQTEPMPGRPGHTVTALAGMPDWFLTVCG